MNQKLKWPRTSEVISEHQSCKTTKKLKMACYKMGKKKESVESNNCLAMKPTKKNIWDNINLNIFGNTKTTDSSFLFVCPVK